MQADDFGQSEITHQYLNKNLAALIKNKMIKANKQRFKIKHLLFGSSTQKNRTLKVLNLAENQIDPAGLVHLADAFFWNQKFSLFNHHAYFDPLLALNRCLISVAIHAEMANQRGAQTTIAQPMLKSTVV
ncbi:hypothetical protein VP01_2727g5 [Puccinia sorghi]|uniref:Uncharacterized protein n=1 Tax=Puccinia sorghi TaxID=27349 RepID=A0A0L6V3C7_9BASI|nr:hypothetical protein VP01_2727g5 [Puccinia sorghi]